MKNLELRKRLEKAAAERHEKWAEQKLIERQEYNKLRSAKIGQPVGKKPKYT